MGRGVTAQRALASVGVKMGGDGRSPLDLGLDLGIVKIKIDALQLGRQVSQKLPEIARPAGRRSAASP